MTIEEIGEPIRAVAAFAGGQMKPLRFFWSGRAYPIETINGRWIDHQPRSRLLHYSVQVGEETCYIHFDTDQLQWWLDRVIVVG